MRPIHAFVAGCLASSALGCTLIDLSALDGSGSNGVGASASTETGVGPGQSCPGSLTSCNDECVDTDTTAKHCGVCRHDCEGGECKSGVCQPALLWIGTQGDSFRATGVELTGDEVYWLSSEGTLAMPKSGGDVRKVS